MIFPLDYRQRLIKQQKSRQYKAMLDQQIRQNYFINQQKNNYKKRRSNTQPNSYSTQNYGNYGYTDKINTAYQRQLPHESTFLPSISPGNLFGPNNIYNSHSNNSRVRNPNYRSRKQINSYNFDNYNSKGANDQSDVQLQKCLQQCDQLIFGINRKFVNIHNHLKGNSIRKKSPLAGYPRNGAHSQFQNIRNDFSSPKHQGSHSRYKSRLSQPIKFQDDVGRNQMMNYNLINAKQKQLMHISMPITSQFGQDGASSSKFNNSLNKNGDKTKRKNGYLFESNNNKTPSRKKNYNGDDEHNEFVDGDFKGMSNSDYINGNKSLSKKEIQKLEQFKKMKKKDSNIIQNLKKAKNKGSILFKKIQMFKKQRQDLIRESQQSPNKSSLKSRNAVNQQNEPNNNVKFIKQNDTQTIKKEDISLSKNNLNNKK